MTLRDECSTCKLYALEIPFLFFPPNLSVSYSLEDSLPSRQGTWYCCDCCEHEDKGHHVAYGAAHSHGCLLCSSPPSKILFSCADLSQCLIYFHHCLPFLVNEGCILLFYFTSLLKPYKCLCILHPLKMKSFKHYTFYQNFLSQKVF